MIFQKGISATISWNYIFNLSKISEKTINTRLSFRSRKNVTYWLGNRSINLNNNLKYNFSLWLEDFLILEIHFVGVLSQK